MAGEAANVRGPCSSCGAQLATDQRYCVECGQRVGPPLALPYAMPAAAAAAPAAASGGLLAKLPVPAQTVTTFAAIALGFGVVVGTAISPNLAGIVAAPSPTVVAQAPQPETPPTPATGGAGGGTGGVAGAGPILGTTFAATSPTTSGGGGSGGGGGGGGGKKKKQKQQPITFDGAVVRVNPVAQSYTISANGALIAIHADTLPGVGDQLSVPVRKLKNGTYAEQGTRSRSGAADSANFLGTVTSCADLEHPATPCSSTPPARITSSTPSLRWARRSWSARCAAVPLPAVGLAGPGRGPHRQPLHSDTAGLAIRLAVVRAPCNPAAASEQNGAPAPPHRRPGA